MVLRLLIGLLKGIVIGGLVGFGLAKLGFAAPGAIIAYLAAAVSGSLVGLVAGKPIWAKEAKIEAGMKAVVGALLGAGLMWLARSFLKVPIPLELGDLAAANDSLQETARNGTLGGLAITSLALVTGVLGAFYDADNTPSDENEGKKDETADAGEKAKTRIASSSTDEDLEDEADAPPADKRAKR
jgi:hypothetical protein